MTNQKSPRLTDNAVKWHILNHPQLSDKALAEIHGISHYTVQSFRWRAKTQGWCCSVRYATCLHCNRPMTVGGRRIVRQAYHPECKPAALANIHKRLNDGRKEKWSTDQMNRELERVRVYDRLAQVNSQSSASRKYQPWTEDDDLTLINGTDKTHLELAEELGRTLLAVRQRVKKLRKWGRYDSH